MTFFSLLSLTLRENRMKVVSQNKVQIMHAVGHNKSSNYRGVPPGLTDCISCYHKIKRQPL